MLKIELPAAEVFDETSSRFVYTNPISLSLEHSLVSISKWEMKWGVPFLSNHEKSRQQILDYVKCMTITQNVPDSAYECLSQSNFDAIKEYIDAPMTATKINTLEQKINREIVTAEIIYYWMVTFNIPFDCQKWHLNRLLTLINVCSIKSQPPKMMKGKTLAKSNAAINAQRRARGGSRG